MPRKAGPCIRRQLIALDTVIFSCIIAILILQSLHGQKNVKDNQRMPIEKEKNAHRNKAMLTRTVAMLM